MHTRTLRKVSRAAPPFALSISPNRSTRPLLADSRLTHSEERHSHRRTALREEEEEGRRREGLITLPLTLLPAPTLVLTPLPVPAPPRAAALCMLRSTAPPELPRSPALRPRPLAAPTSMRSPAGSLRLAAVSTSACAAACGLSPMTSRCPRLAPRVGLRCASLSGNALSDHIC